MRRKNDVVKLGHGHDLIVFQVFLFSAAADTYFCRTVSLNLPVWPGPCGPMSTPVMNVEVTAPRPTTITPSLPSAGLTLVLVMLLINMG